MNGKKTYLVAIGFVAAGVGMYLTGDAILSEAVQYVLSGLGLAGLRHGVATK